MYKLLVLTSTYPRWENDTEPPFVEKLSAGYSDNFIVHVLAPGFPGAKNQEEKRGITVYRFDSLLNASHKLAYNGGILSNLRKNHFYYLLVPLFLASQIIHAYKLHKQHHYDLVHAHWIIPQGVAALILKIISRVKFKILMTSHGGDLYALTNRIFKIIKKYLIIKSDHITVVSNAMKKYCVTLTGEEEKISVISMGVDLKTMFVNKIPFYDRKDLIYVGRLVEKKGVRYLIEAFNKLSEKHPDIMLYIVGDGPERGPLTLLASNNKKIVFIGSVNNNKLPEYYNKAKIAIIPSIVASDGDQEGLGLTIIEAMGCGCAVIASDLEAIRDIIMPGNTGLLVKEKNPDEIAEAINYLLENTDATEKMAGNGQKYVREKFDWGIICSNYSKLIMEIINNKRIL